MGMTKRSSSQVCCEDGKAMHVYHCTGYRKDSVNTSFLLLINRFDSISQRRKTEAGESLKTASDDY